MIGDATLLTLPGLLGVFGLGLVVGTFARLVRGTEKKGDLS